MAKHILLTGANGVVGSAIARRLNAAGHQLLVLARGEAPDKIADFRPDIAIHAAWAGSGPAQRGDAEMLRANYDMSMRVLRAAADAGCSHWLSFGSQAEYSPGLEGPIAENAPLLADNAYGKTKLALCRAQQDFCNNHSMRFTWLRLFSCYGPNLKPDYLIPTLIAALSHGELPALHTPHAVWDFLHADDMSQGVLKALEIQAPSGIYNLAAGKGVSVAEVAMMLARKLNFADMDALAAQIAGNTAPATQRIADITRFTATFAWQPRIALESGLATMLR